MPRPRKKDTSWEQLKLTYRNAEKKYNFNNMGIPQSKVDMLHYRLHLMVCNYLACKEYSHSKQGRSKFVITEEMINKGFESAIVQLVIAQEKHKYDPEV